MGFFTKSHASKKSTATIDSYNGDLTLLDPPSLPSHIPVFNGERSSIYQQSLHPKETPLEKSSFQMLSEQNGLLFTRNAKATVSPTDSELSRKTGQYLVTSASLQGEMERNMILEQQIRMLSQQAALALDKLSEVSKNNDQLKSENDDLKIKLQKKQRFSISNKLNRRQNSISSISTSRSVFTNNGSMSQLSPGTSMSSISSYIQDPQPSAKVIGELQHSYQKELTLIRSEYEDEISKLKGEIETYRMEMIKNDKEIRELTDQAEYYRSKLSEEIENGNSILNKFDLFKKKEGIRRVFYEQQLGEALLQLEDRRERDFLLRQRLTEYDSVRFEVQNAKKLVI